MSRKAHFTRLARHALITASAAGSFAVHAADDAARCAALSTLKLDATTVTQATWTAAGPLDPNPGSTPRMQLQVPAFCRVAATLRPVRDSSIRIEVWLPATPAWNGRFQAVGNGGLAGAILYQPLADALRANYATANTDTGHSGTAVSGEWALGHPERIVDFGHRAVHEMTVKAKAIIDAYYGRKPSYSYWNGCSEGGNQALGEAQRYADDYDGILAGAPANYMTHLQAAGNWISQAIHKDPRTFVPSDKLPALNKAVLAACDATDGVSDGVLNDPRDCNFDVAKLRCSENDSAQCLTDEQIAGIKKVYAGVHNPRTGERIFPGHALGSELEWSNWIAGTASPPTNLQHLIQDSLFRSLVFENANWDWRSFDFDRDLAIAVGKIGDAVNQINPDLSALKQRGGKLIQYHGWYDPAISPLNSIAYFDSVQRRMGDTSSFYRLFMVPGMAHCGGGPGATEFDRMGAIVKWVEQGIAPEAVPAASAKREFTRPLCSYPQVARYDGSGSNREAANFICAARK